MVFGFLFLHHLVSTLSALVPCWGEGLTHSGWWEGFCLPVDFLPYPMLEGFGLLFSGDRCQWV